MLKQYAQYFAAFLLSNVRANDNIERIILFGSAAKDEATAESDVDLFIEVRKKTQSFERDVKEIEGKFYGSREASLFKAKGVTAKLSIKIGKLDLWDDLRMSIAATGIVLYGPYEAQGSVGGGVPYAIFMWDNIEKNRGAFLNKIYGFKVNGKKYLGVLEKVKGERLGKSSIIVPVQHRKDIEKLIKQHGVHARTFDVYR